MQRVLVTRAEPGAGETAERLRALGFEPVLTPSLRIAPEPHDPDLARDAWALAFTSAAGARAWRGRTDAPAFAVGDATAAALRARGFADVRSAAGDGADLAAAIIAARPVGAIAHVRGVDVAFDLAAELSPLGIAVTPIIVYRAEPDRTPLDSGLSGATAALFHSPAGARTFVERVRAGAATDSLRGLRAICLSEAVAQALAGTTWKSIEIADAPTEIALLARLTAAQG